MHFFPEGSLSSLRPPGLWGLGTWTMTPVTSEWVIRHPSLVVLTLHPALSISVTSLSYFNVFLF